jgi:peroxiredoxin/uncharacterized membrane protein YphA (DoxX/SURF4 family)
MIVKRPQPRLDPGADVLSVTELGLLASRLLLAFVFLLAGATKLVDPVGMRRTWIAFGFPAVLARPIVVLLPVFELAVGVLLLPRSLAWYGAWGALGLIASFAMAIGLAMARGRKPDCRCFGRVHSGPVGWRTLARDGVLGLCAAWLASRRPGRLGPDAWAWLTALSGDERKAALVGAAAMVFLFFRLLDRSRPQSEPIESQKDWNGEEEDPVREERPAPVRRPKPAQGPAPAPRPVTVEDAAPPKPPPQGIGLPAGTPAPEFELPGLTGQKRSLQWFRAQGQDLLLVFSSPYCEPCHALAPKLARWTREMEGILNIVVVSRGSVRDNLAKFKDVDPARILLQRGFEISEAYDCTATPTAVVVGADGLIRTELAVGREAIQKLVAPYARRVNR